ncbi:MAG: Uma2 family endonuclease [Cyanophyceae cyanobacterium]
MIAVKLEEPISPEVYLEQERQSPVKREYLDGQVYAMAGISKVHNRISGNLYLLIRNGLKGSPCQTFIADIKVRIEQGKRFFYPDLLVTCDAKDDSDLTYVDHPTVIIEVLSDSTELFDRGKKFQYYRLIPQLQDYVLVSSREYLVEVLHRVEGDRWLLSLYEGVDAIAAINSLNLELPLAEIYADLDLNSTLDARENL